MKAESSTWAEPRGAVPKRPARSGLATLLSIVILVSGCTERIDPAATPSPWSTRITTLTWQVQLTGELDLTADADVFEFDVFSTPAYAVTRLRERGRRLICHLNAGAYEEHQPDAGRYPSEVLGSPTERPGEWWLDIRQWAVLEPILTDRLRLCRGKGFEAVAAANVDGYAHSTGFPLTFDDQIVFNRRVAVLARSVGLLPGLRNNIDQVVALEPDFDFAINEECVARAECERLLPFIAADKPVFHLEYDIPTTDFCAITLGLGFSSIRKERKLGAWRAPCLL